MADIRVYFTNGSTEEETVEDSGNANSPASLGKPKSNTNSLSKSALSTIAIQGGKQALNYGLSIYDDITGDSIQQKRMQSLVSMGATALMMTKFPVGTIAGLTVMTTSTISSLIQDRNTNRNAELLYKRTGNSVLDNSRGTER